MERQLLNTPLRRSGNACLGGVCAGVAEYFDLDPIVVRILGVLVSVVTLGLGALVYLVLWALLPQDPLTHAPYEVSPEQAESSAYGCVDCSVGAQASNDAEKLSVVTWLVIIASLIALFLLVVLGISPMIRGSQWWQFWPVGFVLGGVCLAVLPLGGKHEMAWHALGVIIVAIAASCLPMSLGIASWRTPLLALGHLWPLVVAAIVLYVLGLRRSISSLSVIAALFVVLFCLMMLTSFMEPGEVADLMIAMPGRNVFRVALASALTLF